MKLTVCIFFLSILGVMGNVSAQLITLDVKNMSMERVLLEITKQSDYAFTYEEKDLSATRPITLRIDSKDLAETLRLIFEGQPIQYHIKGKSIVLTPRRTRSTAVPAQNRVEENPDQDPIRGRVTDQGGAPLIGATIRIQDTNITYTTDGDGYFEIPYTYRDRTLEVEYVGYGRQIVLAANIDTAIALSIHDGDITQVDVNAGYWTVSDKLRTGNISRVDGDIIRQQPVFDPILALAGRVAGLEVNQISGVPGAAPLVRIRGTNSIANGNDPLFIVDGVPFTSGTLTSSVYSQAATLSPFSMLNADEIESIEVLKDADATAIYGSRGANGVILITTKKGKEGRTQFNFNSYTGAGKVTRMLDLLNTEQYLEMRREAFANEGVTTYPVAAYDVNGTWDQDRYTDWQEVLIGNTARMSNIQLQVSGGNSQTQFTAGGGWMTENTVFPGEYKTNQGSSNLNVTHRSNDNRFGVNASIRYLKNTGDQPHTDVTVNQVFLPPNAPPIYGEDGELNWENGTWQNPFAHFLRRAKSVSSNFIGNGVLDYRILSGLQAKLSFGYSEQSMKQDLTVPITAGPPTVIPLTTRRRHDQATNQLKSWILEPQLNYSRSIADGILDMTVGGTFQESIQEAISISANDFTDDALIDNIAAAANVRIAQNRHTQYKYAALFGRIHYNWQDRYLLNLVARRDGSSRFAPGRKYGNFASIGGAWLFSSESFLEDSSVLSFGKLRASYGVTGNDQLADYQYFNTYSPYANAYLGTIGLSPTRLHSPDYGWEAVRKLEAGLELGFFDDRIRFSSSLYRNRTNNQLVGYALPTMTGFATIQANLPAVVENKGLELELNTVNIRSARFEWNSAFNISIARNKLVSFPDFETSTYRNTYTLGRSLSTLKRWHYLGVDPETGIVQFEDVDGDGIISYPEDLQSLINLEPRYFGGLSNTLTYANFRLDFFLQFINKIGLAPSSIPGRMSNDRVDVLRRWQQAGDITDIPRYTSGGPAATAISNGFNNSDMPYIDASFIRLKNLSLSYQLSPSVLHYIRARNCRVYIQGQNLFTITNYTGFDPETGASLPPIRMITAGINITF